MHAHSLWANEHEHKKHTDANFETKPSYNHQAGFGPAQGHFVRVRRAGRRAEGGVSGERVRADEA